MSSQIENQIHNKFVFELLCGISMQFDIRKKMKCQSFPSLFRVTS